MGQALDDAPERETHPSSVREKVSGGLRGLFQRVERAGGSLAAGAARGRGRAVEAAEGLRRPIPLRHGLAAAERGNLDAALALLLEAVEHLPDDAEAVLALWNVALSCERPEVAAPSMARWIHHEASSERRDLAAEHWMELHDRVPEQRVDVATLVRLLPELRQRVSAARGPEERARAEAWQARALRACVDPEAPGMTTGLALRVFEQARFLDVEVARRAGEVVLAASDLHDTKRQHVESLLAELDARPAAATPDASEAEAPEIFEVVPVELAGTGLIVREADGAQRTRVDLRSLEAVVVAQVDGLAEGSVDLVDLVLRRRAPALRRRVFRMRGDAFDPDAVLSDAPAGDAPLLGLPAALLDRSGAVPLPDPDSVLGTRPRHFDSLEAYEQAVLGPLLAR